MEKHNCLYSKTLEGCGPKSGVGGGGEGSYYPFKLSLGPTVDNHFIALVCVTCNSV